MALVAPVAFDGLAGVLRGEQFSVGRPDRSVLLLHGGGQNRHSWDRVAHYVAARGWLAITLDQRGHGDSDWSVDRMYSSSDFADDVVAVVDQIAGANGGQSRPVLVGASLGGIASLIASARRAEGVGGLVLVDIAPRTERLGTDRVREFMRSGLHGFAGLDEAAKVVARYKGRGSANVNHDRLKRSLRFGNDGLWRWHWDPEFVTSTDREDSEARREILLEYARGVQVPTLLIRGTKSNVVSLEGAAELKVAMPHARVVTVEGAGHMVASDDNANFSLSLLTFLESFN